MSSLVAHNTAWLVAAENDALPGGKVGGVGDVIRDLPPALAAEGCPVRVITPSYGLFHTRPGWQHHRNVEVAFAGGRHTVEVWEGPESPGVRTFALEHERLSVGQPGQVYCADPEGRPFETDAGKFAFFCAAVAAWVEQAEKPPAVLHLHDWHTGLVPLLLQGSEQRPRTVFTIHNLAYQGVRPRDGHASSMAAWFPESPLIDDPSLADPRYADCVNFMASAIRLSDILNTVSPTYAGEITRPNAPELGFRGGEGLEQALSHAAGQGRLIGILNGCVYPGESGEPPVLPDLLEAAAGYPAMMDASPSLAERLERLVASPPDHLLLAIGRLVGQKVDLFLAPVPGAPTALDAILDDLGEHGAMLLLGSGDAVLERRLHEVAARHENLLFFHGYAEKLSDLLYRLGDLFLMPSSFEPCGISQMLAMREGQPCLVHGVGGLVDTVDDGVTGFVFHGASQPGQAVEFVATVHRALALKTESPAAWAGLGERAAAARFDWSLAARRYLTECYAHVP